MLVKNPHDIKLGIIGMTAGNGHPYSWSAIINGYDKKKMAECPFATIPEYLNREPEESYDIKSAQFTHIYCNKREDAERVAEASLIANVVDTPEEMIGKVDAVVIATDIGSEHVERARPFVAADLPLFIDKPLCDNHDDLLVFSKWVNEENKVILSSSSRRYAPEIVNAQKEINKLNPLSFISLTIMKKWETYGIHALETVYPILGPGFLSVQNTGTYERNIVHLTHKNGTDVIIACGIDLPAGTIRLQSKSVEMMIKFSSVFNCFKAQLLSFIAYLQTGKPPYPFSETEELMRVLIAGKISRENDGEKILL